MVFMFINLTKEIEILDEYKKFNEKRTNLYSQTKNKNVSFGKAMEISFLDVFYQATASLKFLEHSYKNISNNKISKLSIPYRIERFVLCVICTVFINAVRVITFIPKFLLQTWQIYDGEKKEHLFSKNLTPKCYNYSLFQLSLSTSVSKKEYSGISYLKGVVFGIASIVEPIFIFLGALSHVHDMIRKSVLLLLGKGSVEHIIFHFESANIELFRAVIETLALPITFPLLIVINFGTVYQIRNDK